MGEPDDFRPLPQGAKTRDELRALIAKHGSLSVADALKLINRSASPSWTRGDFINFFQKSDQRIFEVGNDRLYLAISHSSDESSDDEKLVVRSSASLQASARARNGNGSSISEIDKLTDNFDRSLRNNLCHAEGKAAAAEHSSSPATADRSPASSASGTRKSKPSRPPAKVFVWSSGDESEDAGVPRRSKPCGPPADSSKRLTKPPPGFEACGPEYDGKPFGSEEEEQEKEARLHSKMEVVKLVHGKRRHFPQTRNIDSMVTMDPDPANKIVPKLKFSSDSDSSDDDKFEADPPNENSTLGSHQGPPGGFRDRQQKSSPLAVDITSDSSKCKHPAPRSPELPGPSRKLADESINAKRNVQPETKRNKVILNGTIDHHTNFRDTFFAEKEEKDFKESRERDPEKILKDIMKYGKVSKEEAERYLEYFVLLENNNVECLSNGQLVAGTLYLVESDENGEMLQQIRELDVDRQAK